MGELLACTQFVLIACICVYEVKRKSPAVFLWATLMVMFGVMHLLSVFTSNSMYSDATLNKASLFVVGFCLMYIITRNILCLSQGSHYPLLLSGMDDREKDNISVLIILFSLVAFLMCYKLISHAGGLMNVSWASGRDYTGSLGYGNSAQLYNILYFSLSGLPIYLWLKKRRIACFLCIAIIACLTILTRNRIQILPALVCFLSIYIIRIRKIQIKHVIFAAIAGIFVIYLVYALRVFRHYGTIAVFLRAFNAKEFFNKINEYIATDNGELGLRNDFYFFVEGKNQFKGFNELATYVRMLLVYIPTRFSFGLKPDDFAITMGAAIGMVEGGSTHPTLFGDCYANANVFGIFLGCFWACYCSIADRIIIKCKNQVLKALFFGLFAVTFIIMGRGSVYNPFFNVAWGIPTLCIIIVILKNIPKIIFRLK